MGRRKRIKERKERIRRSRRSMNIEPITVVKKIQLKKVISGGQTGADYGGLIGANHSSIETGGTAPKNFMTEEGPNPIELKKLGLEESSSIQYPERTKRNVRNSDGTLWIGVEDTKGGKLTIRTCEKMKKPFLKIPYLWSHKVKSVHPINYAEQVIAWIRKHNIQVLNVAGNRESINYGISGFASGLISSVCGEMRYPGFYIKQGKINLKKDKRSKEEESKRFELKAKKREMPRRRLDPEDLREPRRKLYPTRRKLNA